MIRGIGCDLCGIERMEPFLAEEKKLRYLFTENEIASLRGNDARRREHLAGLFAAKEAVSKALGSGFTGFRPTDIEVTPDALGRPCACLTGGAEKRLREIGGDTVHISISHDGGMAAAFCVIETSSVTADAAPPSP